MSTGFSIHIGVDSPGNCRCNDRALTRSKNSAETLMVFASNRFQSIGNFAGTAYLAPIEKAIGQAATSIRQAGGGTLLLTFAGHGCQKLIYPTIGEPDGYEENWCLSGDPLLDSKLDDLLHLFDASAKIVIISESCHSGGMVVERNGSIYTASASELDEIQQLAHRWREERNAFSGRSRFLTWPSSLSDSQIVALRRLELWRKPRRSVTARVLLLAACKENQEATDGVFTGKILELMKGAYRPQSYGELICRASSDIAAQYRSQTPGWAFNETLLADRPFEP